MHPATSLPCHSADVRFADLHLMEIHCFIGSRVFVENTRRINQNPRIEHLGEIFHSQSFVRYFSSSNLSFLSFNVVLVKWSSKQFWIEKNFNTTRSVLSMVWTTSRDERAKLWKISTTGLDTFWLATCAFVNTCRLNILWFPIENWTE